MTEQCINCQFWKASVLNEHHQGYEMGDCRRNPPALIDAMVRAELPVLQYGQQADPELGLVSQRNSTMFPVTSHDDWCGEYRRAR